MPSIPALFQRLATNKPAMVLGTTALAALLLGGLLLASGTLDDPAPEAPAAASGGGGGPACATAVTAEALSGGHVRLAWNAVAGAEGYTVLRAMGSGALTPLATVSGLSHVDATATAGTTYRYVVVAAVEGADAATCAPVEITAVPEFGSLAVGALALLGGVGAYVGLARRR